MFLVSLRKQSHKIVYLYVLHWERPQDVYKRQVFACFKLPKTTDEEKAARSAAIQEATKQAALVPLEVARKALDMTVSYTHLHGIGKEMHEDPQVPNYGKRGYGPLMKRGLCICLLYTSRCV